MVPGKRGDVAERSVATQSSEDTGRHGWRPKVGCHRPLPGPALTRRSYGESSGGGRPDYGCARAQAAGRIRMRTAVMVVPDIGPQTTSRVPTAMELSAA